MKEKQTSMACICNLRLSLRPHHCSFIRQGGSWPEHCITGSKCAEFSADLQLPASAYIISKGTVVEKDGYLSFSSQTFTKRVSAVCSLADLLPIIAF